MKLSTVIGFELLYNVRKVYTYIFFVLLIFQGIWYTIGTNDLFANSNVMLNAPAINYQNLGIMGILLFVVTAIVSGGTLGRDLESGSANVIYPMIVNEKTYFWGKYVGAVIVNLAIVIGYPLGILLFPYLGIGTPEQFGTVPLGQLVHALVLFVLPNLLFLVTFSVFLVVVFRKALAAYIGVLLIMIFFLVSVTLRSESTSTLLTELLDPFGYCSIANITEKMDVHELNTAYLPVTKALLFNRIIWACVTIALLAWSVFRFNFKSFIAPAAKKKPADRNVDDPNRGKTAAMGAGVPHFTRLYGIQTSMQKTVQFAWQDLRIRFRSPVFFAIMVTLFLMFTGFSFIWTSTYYLTTSHLPLTSTMAFIRIPMMLVISVLLIILSGELLFRDRTSGVWTCADITPTPSWVFVLSRWLTMGCLGLFIFVLIMVAGILTQLVMGFRDIEWGVYFRDLFLSRFGWLTSLQIISMVFFFGALFNNRLKGHIFSVASFLFISGSVDYGLIEQLHLGFPFVPGVFGPERYNYSEMNGYGVLDAGMNWYTAAWSILGMLFLALSIMLWNRGVDRSVKERLVVVRRKLRTPRGRGLAVFIALGLVLFTFCEIGIVYYSNYKGGYRTKAQLTAEAADYETKYGAYRELPQPKITDLDLNLELFPEQRKASYIAELTVINPNNEPIDTLHLDWSEKLFVTGISSKDTPIVKHQDDEALRHAVYRLRNPLAAGQSMRLTVNGALAYRGFNQSDFQGDLTYNGTVLGTDFLPLFGYDHSRELDNNKKRIRQGLAPLEDRMAGIDNPYFRAVRFGSNQSDGTSWKIVVGTSGSQTIVGPGEKVKSWEADGRNYALFQSDKPGAMNFKIVSARLTAREFNCGTIPCILFHDPRHTYNLDVFQKTMEQAVPWLSKKLGLYPYSLLQVVEKPFYDDDFITFANVTAVSEARGWTADIKKPEDGQYIYLNLATELAKHWLGSLLKVADVQGAGLLTESIARYYGLRFMDEIWGDAETAKWLDKAFKDYEEGKGKEAIEEKPLLLVDKAPYLSRDKGGLALYAMARRSGVEDFDRWLETWLAQAGQKDGFLTSVDFYRDLKNHVPAGLHPFARGWFEKRVQYRISIDSAQIAGRKLVLTLSVARRNHSRQGAIKESFSAPLEVGLVGESGHVQKVKQIVLQPGTHTYEMVVESAATTVILDPHYWYLIENRKRCSRSL